MCEDCGLKRPSWGLPDAGNKYRWCSDCAEQHSGVVNFKGQADAESRAKAKLGGRIFMQKLLSEASGNRGLCECPATHMASASRFSTLFLSAKSLNLAGGFCKTPFGRLVGLENG